MIARISSWDWPRWHFWRLTLQRLTAVRRRITQDQKSQASLETSAGRDSVGLKESLCPTLRCLYPRDRRWLGSLLFSGSNECRTLCLDLYFFVTGSHSWLWMTRVSFQLHVLKLGLDCSSDVMASDATKQAEEVLRKIKTTRTLLLRVSMRV